ncbi:MAG: serine/threonine-protein kinase, partial [Fimbriiglobus sp.]
MPTPDLPSAGEPLDPPSVVFQTLAEPQGTVTEPPADPPPHPRDLSATCPLAIQGYAVEGVLGYGGMGVVYKAWDTRINRPVALKMMIGGRYGDPIGRVRFQIEAEVVAQLQHTNVVQLYEFGVHDGQPFVALEFVGGGSLAEKLKAGGALSPVAAAEMVAKIADAVAAAHAKGIIHRDLKPHNILLTPDGEPKVTDFGLARVGESDMTATGAVLGTPAYMAPEQAAGRTREVGTASDVYALGVVLYELATGRRPFDGPPEQVVIQHIMDEPVAPRSLSRNIPWDFQTICLKCLAKDPKKRYPAAALAADLRAFLDGRPITARPVGTLERVAKWGRRNPWRAAAVGAAVTAVLGTVSAAVVVERNREAARRTAEDRAIDDLIADKAHQVVEALTVADT